MTSQTHRSLSQKRYPSYSQQSLENIESWDQVGLLNQKLNQVQLVRSSGLIYKRFQGDKILNSKRNNFTERQYLNPLPQIDQSMKMQGSFYSQISQQISGQQLKKVTSILPSQSPNKKQLKSEKLKLLILLNSLRKNQESERRPTAPLCLLVYEILDILKKQDNIYGEEMKVFFSVIRDMIFCSEEDIIDFVSALGRSKSEQTNTDEGLPNKPYFEYIRLMKKEIQMLGNRLSSNKNDSQAEVQILTVKLNQLQERLEDINADTAREISALQNQKSDEAHRNIQKIEGLNFELQKAAKENQSLKEQFDKSKQKADELEAKLKSSMVQISELKERIEFSKKSGNKDSDQLTKANEKINHLTLELKELKDRFGSMTPRPSFEGCQDIINWIGAEGFSELSSFEKVEIFKLRIDDKLSELNKMSPKSPKKNRDGLKQVTLAPPSPTKKSDKTVQLGSVQDNLIKRNTKKAQTQIKTEGANEDNEQKDDSQLILSDSKINLNKSFNEA